MRLLETLSSERGESGEWNSIQVQFFSWKTKTTLRKPETGAAVLSNGETVNRSVAETYRSVHDILVPRD